MRGPLAGAAAVSLAIGLVTAAAGSSGAAEAEAATVPPALERWEPDVRSATRYARDRRGDVRFAIIEPEGTVHGFHAGRTAPAASVFKAMLLATYLRQGDVRHRALRRSDRRLLRPMIRRSDNDTATRVRDIVGGAAIERLADRAGMRRFRLYSTWGLSRTSAGDQARFFRGFERCVPKRHEDYARRLLSSIVASQRWGVGQAQPDGWELFFKGGWGRATGRVNHQVAFLERHEQRVSLAILTEFNPSHDYGKRTLQGMAKRLLDGLPKLPAADG